MSYQTYIFDLDGTLLDTLGDLAASVNYAMRTHGMPEHSVDEVCCFVGNGVRRLMEVPPILRLKRPLPPSAVTIWNIHSTRRALTRVFPRCFRN